MGRPDIATAGARGAGAALTCSRLSAALTDKMAASANRAQAPGREGGGAQRPGPAPPVTATGRVAVGGASRRAGPGASSANGGSEPPQEREPPAYSSPSPSPTPAAVTGGVSLCDPRKDAAELLLKRPRTTRR